MRAIFLIALLFSSNTFAGKYPPEYLTVNGVLTCQSLTSDSYQCIDKKDPVDRGGPLLILSYKNLLKMGAKPAKVVRQ